MNVHSQILKREFPLSAGWRDRIGLPPETCHVPVEFESRRSHGRSDRERSRPCCHASRGPDAPSRPERRQDAVRRKDPARQRVSLPAHAGVRARDARADARCHRRLPRRQARGVPALGRRGGPASGVHPGTARAGPVRADHPRGPWRPWTVQRRLRAGAVPDQPLRHVGVADHRCAQLHRHEGHPAVRQRPTSAPATCRGSPAAR